MSALLFSYGTLQDTTVQQAVFGEVLMNGDPDRLVGFRQQQINIEGKLYPIIEAVFGGLTHADFIEGKVYFLTPSQWQQADEYEGIHYQRQLVTLDSGKQAWVYVSRG